jgi:hypothetical protein
VISSPPKPAGIQKMITPMRFRDPSPMRIISPVPRANRALMGS